MTTIVIKRPLGFSYPSIAHTLAAMRYFDQHYGPLQYARALRDPTTKALRSTLFVKLPSDRAVEAIRKEVHVIPIYSEHLGHRKHRVTLNDCFPSDADLAKPASTFHVQAQQRTLKSRPSSKPQEPEQAAERTQRYRNDWLAFKRTRPRDPKAV